MQYDQYMLVTLLQALGVNRDPEPRFFQGGGVEVGTMGLQNQWGMPTKHCNLRIGTRLKIFTPKTLAMLKVEITVRHQSRVYYFCRNIIMRA